MALWLIHPGAEFVAQPVVFFGSEGDVGVVARDLGDFLWLLADGAGPMEAVEPGSIRSEPNAELRAWPRSSHPAGNIRPKTCSRPREPSSPPSTPHPRLTGASRIG